MKDLKEFQKDADKSERFTTSVNITKAQHRWLDKNGINLSKLVRAYLQEIMKSEKQNSKEGKNG